MRRFRLKSMKISHPIAISAALPVPMLVLYPEADLEHSVVWVRTDLKNRYAAPRECQ